MSKKDFVDSLSKLCDYSTSKVRCNGRDINQEFKHGDCSIPGFKQEFDDMDAAW